MFQVVFFIYKYLYIRYIFIWKEFPEITVKMGEMQI